MRHQIVMLFLFSAILVFPLVILAEQQPENLPQRKASTNMNENGQFLWTSTPQTLAGKPVVYFSYSPELGLSDVDSHEITEKNWDMMKSPVPDAVARLDVLPDLTLQQLQQAVALLKSKGKYQTIEIVVGR